MSFFEALDAYEERHFNSVLNALLFREGNAERFLAELGRGFHVDLPDHGPLHVESESRVLEDQWPDHIISDDSRFMTIIECKVMLGSVREKQIQEQIDVGYRHLASQDWEARPSQRSLLYLYIAPDGLALDVSKFRPAAGSPAGPRFLRPTFIPLSKVAELFQWLDETDSPFYGDLRNYLTFLTNGSRMEPMDEKVADHVEALAQLGLEKVYNHIVREARQIKRVAQSELDTIATLRGIAPENSLVHTYVSVAADWYPSWLVYMYFDLGLEPGGPTVYGMIQSKDRLSEKAKRDQKSFVQAMKSRFPTLEQYTGRNFAGLRLTSRNFLREPDEAADEAGHKFAAFVRAAHDVWTTPNP